MREIESECGSVRGVREIVYVRERGEWCGGSRWGECVREGEIIA